MSAAPDGRVASKGARAQWTAKTKTPGVAILGGGICRAHSSFRAHGAGPEPIGLRHHAFTRSGWRLGGKAVGRARHGKRRPSRPNMASTSGPAIYDNCFDIVKRLYARLKEARRRVEEVLRGRSTISPSMEYYRR